MVKRYAYVRDQMIEGGPACAEDVRARRYPDPDHAYTMAPDDLRPMKSHVAPAGEPFTGCRSL